MFIRNTIGTFVKLIQEYIGVELDCIEVGKGLIYNCNIVTNRDPEIIMPFLNT